jgi:hypothetical protein
VYEIVAKQKDANNKSLSPCKAPSVAGGFTCEKDKLVVLVTSRIPRLNFFLELFVHTAASFCCLMLEN